MNAECHSAECRILFIVMLTVIMVNVVAMLSVVMQSVVMLSVVAPFLSSKKHSSLFFKNIVTKIETDNLMKNLTFKERGKGGRQKD